MTGCVIVSFRRAQKKHKLRRCTWQRKLVPNEAAGGVPCTVLELLDVVIRLEGRSILVVEPLHVRRRDDKFEIGSRGSAGVDTRFRARLHGPSGFIRVGEGDSTEAMSRGCYRWGTYLQEQAPTPAMIAPDVKEVVWVQLTAKFCSAGDQNHHGKMEGGNHFVAANL
ncbi:hypothetical protein BDV98DRAFT_579573 [Pterulicium gracile]|uniref:Uncharacterized protein n=1 Tax=Pterulicium gracile TaxID=1884261 RepID=A0A5C3QZ79_9AGAR|nr:hypothetical protein BDV98DRAFT_579573 [Pterula gracilis]